MPLEPYEYPDVLYCDQCGQDVDSKIGDIEKELGQLDEQLKYFSVERANGHLYAGREGDPRKVQSRGVPGVRKDLV